MFSTCLYCSQGAVLEVPAQVPAIASQDGENYFVVVEQTPFGTKGQNSFPKTQRKRSPEPRVLRHWQRSHSHACLATLEARARSLGLSRRFVHWSGGLQGDRLAGPRPRIFSVRKTCQVTDPTPVLGGTHPVLRGWGPAFRAHFSSLCPLSGLPPR